MVLEPIALLMTQGFFVTDLLPARTEQDGLTPLCSFLASWWLVGMGTMTLEGVLYGFTVIFKTLAMVLVVPPIVFTTEVVGLVAAGIGYFVLDFGEFASQLGWEGLL